MKVSIIVPNWNGWQLLKKNLPAVIKACQKLAKTDWEIIVADDASTDKSVAFLNKEFPQIRVITHKERQYFAANCNSGVKTAKGEVVVLLNTDVSPDPNFLEPLLDRFKDSQVFSAGCKEKDTWAGKTIFSGRGLGEFKRGFLVHWRAEDQGQTDTLWTSGGSMAVDRGKWLELGGMDTLFQPAYWEDIDLCWRARKKGWRIIFEPKSVVNHHHESTNIAAFGQKEMKKFAYKNQFLFVWKNGSIKMLWEHLFWLPYHLLKTALRGDFLFWQGFFLALKQLPELLKKKHE